MQITNTSDMLWGVLFGVILTIVAMYWLGAAISKRRLK